jgi:hypothetical protein
MIPPDILGKINEYHEIISLIILVLEEMKGITEVLMIISIITSRTIISIMAMVVTILIEGGIIHQELIVTQAMATLAI